MTYITIATKKEGYAVDQCENTMTVQEMIDYLSQFDSESKVYFSNDNGYTYGSIKDYYFDEVEIDEDEDDE